MPTYLETSLEENPDFGRLSLGMTWLEFLTLPKKAYNSELLNKAVNASASWVTCACGNQCDIIPRDDDGSPLDDELYHLGCNFAHLIERLAGFYLEEEEILEFSLSRSTALDLLKEIEHRANLILSQLQETN